MVLSSLCNPYMQPDPLVCPKLEWDGGSSFQSLGKMCALLKMKQDSVTETHRHGTWISVIFVLDLVYLLGLISEQRKAVP